MIRRAEDTAAGDGSVECSGDTGASSQQPLLQCPRHQSWRVHPLTLAHLTILLVISHIFCRCNKFALHSQLASCIQLCRAPCPALPLVPGVGWELEPDSSASLEQSGPVETSQDQSRGSEFGTIVKLGPGGGGAAPCSAAAAGRRIPHSLGCLR